MVINDQKELYMYVASLGEEVGIKYFIPIPVFSVPILKWQWYTIDLVMILKIINQKWCDLYEFPHSLSSPLPFLSLPSLLIPSPSTSHSPFLTHPLPPPRIGPLVLLWSVAVLQSVLLRHINWSEQKKSIKF